MEVVSVEVTEVAVEEAGMVVEVADLAIAMVIEMMKLFPWIVYLFTFPKILIYNLFIYLLIYFFNLFIVQVAAVVEMTIDVVANRTQV